MSIIIECLCPALLSPLLVPKSVGVSNRSSSQVRWLYTHLHFNVCIALPVHSSFMAVLMISGHWEQSDRSEGICLCAKLFLWQLKITALWPLKTLSSELWSFRGAKHWQPCCFALFSSLHILYSFCLLKASIAKCVCVQWSRWYSLWCHTKGASVLIGVVWVLKWQVCAE